MVYINIPSLVSVYNRWYTKCFFFFFFLEKQHIAKIKPQWRKKTVAKEERVIFATVFYCWLLVLPFYVSVLMPERWYMTS